MGKHRILGTRGMTLGSEWRDRLGSYHYGPVVPNARPQRLLAGIALVGVMSACAWTLGINIAGGSAEQGELGAVRKAEREIVQRVAGAARRGDKLVVAHMRPAAAAIVAAWNAQVSLFDPHATAGMTPGSFVASAALVAQDAGTAAPADVATTASLPPAAAASSRSERVASAAPIAPPAEPSRNAALRHRAREDAPRNLRSERAIAGAAAPAEEPSIFERLFGKSKPVALAYAAPDDSGLTAGQNIAGRYDRSTAVYDITAHTVYLPDGTRLEAHSGLGNRLDDPHYAHERNRGVTPPAVYSLEPREALFHGVRALRLIPEDESKVFGRSGLLAHSFMLGPNGDSNGCVSIRNYEAFLRAYQNHEITRLAVVERAE
jgi:hypothetical protein